MIKWKEMRKRSEIKEMMIYHPIQKNKVEVMNEYNLIYIIGGFLKDHTSTHLVWNVQLKIYKEYQELYKMASFGITMRIIEQFILLIQVVSLENLLKVKLPAFYYLYHHLHH